MKQRSCIHCGRDPVTSVDQARLCEEHAQKKLEEVNSQLNQVNSKIEQLEAELESVKEKLSINSYSEFEEIRYGEKEVEGSKDAIEKAEELYHKISEIKQRKRKTTKAERTIKRVNSQRLCCTRTNVLVRRW